MLRCSSLVSFCCQPDESSSQLCVSAGCWSGGRYFLLAQNTDRHSEERDRSTYSLLSSTRGGVTFHFLRSRLPWCACVVRRLRLCGVWRYTACGAARSARRNKHTKTHHEQHRKINAVLPDERSLRLNSRCLLLTSSSSSSHSNGGNGSPTYPPPPSLPLTVCP